jgi:hypothetical protein
LGNGLLPQLMKGPYPLNLIQISLLVKPKAIGIFLIYNEKKEVIFIGRSDEDLSKELKKFLEQGKFFAFEYTINPKEAYLSECKYFHKYENNPNFIRKDHPLPPSGVEVKCPVCGL